MEQLVYLDIPEGGAAVGGFGEAVEGAGGGEEAAFFFVWLDPGEEVGERGKLLAGTGIEKAVDGVLAQAFEVNESEAEGVVVEDGGVGVGVEDGDGFGFYLVTFGIFEEGGDRVEAHRLVVEEAGVEFGGVVGFEPAGGVGDEGEGDGVGFREAVEGEGTDCFGNLVLHEGIDVALGHAEAQFFGDRFDPFVGAFEGHGAAEFIGFGAIEGGDDHGHAEDLFLEEGDAEGASEDGLEGGVDEVDRFASAAAVEVRVNKVADDGARADDGDFDGEVVEGFGLHDGEGGHLGTGLDLEGADGVGAAEEGEGGGVVFGDAGEVDGMAALLADVEGIFHRGEHAEAEEVDFDDAEVFAVVFIPLHDGAVGHGGGLEGDDGVEAGVADDHASGVLAEVAGVGEDGFVEVDEGCEAGVGCGDADFGEWVDWVIGYRRRGVRVALRRFFFGRRRDAYAPLGEFVGEVFGEAEDFGHLAKGGAGAVGDDVGGHGGPAGSVFFEDVLDDCFAAVAGGEVDIDVGPGLAVLGEKAFEEEAAADGIDGGDAEAIADRRVGCGAPTLAEDALGLGELGDLPNDEEVSGESKAMNESKLMLKVFADVLTYFAVTATGALEGELMEEGGFFVGAEWPFCLRVVEGGKLVAEVFESEVESVGETVGIEEGFGEIGEELLDLLRGFQVALGIGLEESAGIVEGAMVAEAGKGIGEEAVLTFGKEGGVGGEKGEFEVAGEVAEEGLEASFAAAVVTGEFDVDVVLPEGADEGSGHFEEVLAGGIGEGLGGEEGG